MTLTGVWLQVDYIPRCRWVSRNTVSPACCSAPAGRPLGQKKQTASFNERRELRSLSWNQRMERGCHGAWAQRHCAKAAGTDCQLTGPLTRCQVDTWYVLSGPALAAVTNSPFCEGELLKLLNEASSDSTLHWASLPRCGSCHAPSEASVLSDVARLCATEGGGERQRCRVFGSSSAWSEHQAEGLILTICAEPSLCGCTSLHDGEPQYQRELLACVASSLESLSSGDALLLPVVSALTRVTAAVVHCLHACFHSLTFRCPRPSGRVGALLVCVGFCPEAARSILPVLAEVRDCLSPQKLAKGEPMPPGSDRQVLQFVPMEELLAGGLTDFLWTMNAEIIQQKLHLLMQS